MVEGIGVTETLYSILLALAAFWLGRLSFLTLDRQMATKQGHKALWRRQLRHHQRLSGYPKWQ